METHFKKHNGFCACNRNKKNNLTEVWHKVTCDSCERNDEYLMAKQDSPRECKYPNLKKAIENKVEFFVKVNPEQSEEVQKIAFSCGIYWVSGSERVGLTINEKLYIGYDTCDNKYYIFSGHSRKLPEFSLEHDCFVDEIKQEMIPSKEKQYKDGCTDRLIKEVSFSKDNEIFGVKIDSIIETILDEHTTEMTPNEIYQFGCEAKKRLNRGNYETQ